MTRNEYHRLAPVYDRPQVAIDNAIATIPQNINRAGKHYQKLIKKIYDETREVSSASEVSPTQSIRDAST